MKYIINKDELKEGVRSAYAKLVAEQKQTSCCESSSNCCSPIVNESKGELVKLVDYEDGTLTRIPKNAVENSFGCGDPLAFSDVKEGQTVIDIGSGAGIDCFIASEKVGGEGKVIGIDMTPEMIDRATKNAQAGGYTNIEFRLGDAENMPVEVESADWVISNCVINLSPDKPKVFSEIARVLKPGGQISISDIVLGDDLPEVISDSFAAWTGCVAGAIKESDYISGLKEAGLSEVHIDTRQVYDESVIKQFFSAAALNITEDEFKNLLSQITGKIWSAKIRGTK